MYDPPGSRIRWLTVLITPTAVIGYNTQISIESSIGWILLWLENFEGPNTLCEYFKNPRKVVNSLRSPAPQLLEILRSNRLVIMMFIILSIDAVTFTIAIEMFSRSLLIKCSSLLHWHYPDEGWHQFRFLRLANRYINTFVNFTFGEILERIGTCEGFGNFLQHVWSVPKIINFEFSPEIH